jgi:hypothetical protein
MACPFCGEQPRVFWNGGMVIRCVNVDCLRPRTEWWADVDKCVVQWNMRRNASFSQGAEAAGRSESAGSDS